MFFDQVIKKQTKLTLKIQFWAVKILHKFGFFKWVSQTS